MKSFNCMAATTFITDDSTDLLIKPAGGSRWLLPNGQVNTAVPNVGMAWYQPYIEADRKGNVEVQIRTILLDQIFGVDQATRLPPTNTFHVGFWFNNPNDAATCGFAVNSPTPFNGEHQAGPLAMISLPDPVTNLGPFCTKPQSNGTCHP